MSRYLIRRIEETPNITLHTQTRIVGLEGGEVLEKVTWLDDATGQRSTHPIRHVFSMAGAEPNTAWLQGCLRQDDKGFLLTGPDLAVPNGGGNGHTHHDGVAAPVQGVVRPAHLFETSLPRVFAVGDVRANSVKRVASAVGEGSVCIQLVHKVLTE
jgi:thioredoxin reductase (NADPH)